MGVDRGRRADSADGAPREVITVVLAGYGIEAYIRDLAEKDAKIQELTSRLNEFERKRSFAPSGPNLPDDYYDNDIYLAE